MKTNDEIEDALFANIVAIGVREEGTVRDLDTLIIDRQKTIKAILGLKDKWEREAVLKKTRTLLDFHNMSDDEAFNVFVKEDIEKQVHELTQESK